MEKGKGKEKEKEKGKGKGKEKEKGNIKANIKSIYRGQISKVKETIESDSNFQKGEFVILVAPIHHEKKEVLTEDQHRILKILLNHMPTNAAVKLGVEILNINKNYLYDEALKIKEI